MWLSVALEQLYFAGREKIGTIKTMNLKRNVIYVADSNHTKRGCLLHHTLQGNIHDGGKAKRHNAMPQHPESLLKTWKLCANPAQVCLFSAHPIWKKHWKSHPQGTYLFESLQYVKSLSFLPCFNTRVSKLWGRMPISWSVLPGFPRVLNDKVFFKIRGCILGER